MTSDEAKNRVLLGLRYPYSVGRDNQDVRGMLAVWHEHTTRKQSHVSTIYDIKDAKRNYEDHNSLHKCRAGLCEERGRLWRIYMDVPSMGYRVRR